MDNDSRRACISSHLRGGSSDYLYVCSSASRLIGIDTGAHRRIYSVALMATVSPAVAFYVCVGMRVRRVHYVGDSFCRAMIAAKS